MLDQAKNGEETIRTAHSLNPVPFVLFVPGREIVLKEGSFGLANVAPTVLTLFGIEAPESWEESVILSEREL